MAVEHPAGNDGRGDGADLEDAGYAYLPLGARPTSDSSSGPPTLRPLGGDWYSFTGTW